MREKEGDVEPFPKVKFLRSKLVQPWEKIKQVLSTVQGRVVQSVIKLIQG